MDKNVFFNIFIIGFIFYLIIIMNFTAIKCSQSKIVKSDLKFHSRIAFFQQKQTYYNRLEETIRN